MDVKAKRELGRIAGPKKSSSIITESLKIKQGN